MKKILLAVCAIALLGLTACKKDPVTPTPTPEPQHSGEGVYSPAVKITSVEYGGGTVETWQWDDGKLTSITREDADGNDGGGNYFTYDSDWRITTMNMTGETPAIATYTYAGKKLNTIDVTSSGMQLAMIQVQHNSADKINHLDIEVNEMLIQMLIQMISSNMGGGIDLANPATSLLSGNIGRTLAKVDACAKNGHKISYTSSDFDADFEWSGDNVSRVTLDANIVLGVTVAELSSLLSMFGDTASSMATMLETLSTLMGDNELPLTLNIKDTMEFAYDQHVNPMQGLLGIIDIAALSANNTTMSTTSGVVNATLTYSIPFVGSQDVPFSFPLESSIVTTDYTYLSNGYPQTSASSDGETKTYTYNN